MYERGMSTSDITEHLQEIYRLSFSTPQISRITDKILVKVEEWKNRPLKACYPFVFLEATYFNVKSNGKIIKKATYVVVVVGIDLEGQKDILSITIDHVESSKL